MVSLKVGRNDPCPCGSGKKYKKCCLGKADVHDAALDIYRQHGIRVKTPEAVQGIRKAGELVMRTFEEVRPLIRPGVTTDEINAVVHEFTVRHGARPAPLGYRGYPKSVCVSLNEVVCHGIPSDRIMRDGDIVNVDITSILDGYYADCNQTFFVGTPGQDAQKIVAVARESLRIGMEQVRPGNVINDIGKAIQKYAEGQGCSVVRDFMGHGVGYSFHEPPDVAHFDRPGHSVPIVPGMVFTIEPMINLGDWRVKVLNDKWTAVTKDSSLSAQFEQTLVVTSNGCESLTPF